MSQNYPKSESENFEFEKKKISDEFWDKFDSDV
jgi:hypothetical protein